MAMDSAAVTSRIEAGTIAMAHALLRAQATKNLGAIALETLKRAAVAGKRDHSAAILTTIKAADMAAEVRKATGEAAITA